MLCFDNQFLISECINIYVGGRKDSDHIKDGCERDTRLNLQR